MIAAGPKLGGDKQQKACYVFARPAVHRACVSQGRNGGSCSVAFPSRSDASVAPFRRPRKTAMVARLFASLVLLAALAGAPQPVAAQSKLTVFAAASMRNALEDANKAFTRATDIKVVTSYAASSALAKQIAQGAPADVFVSANIKWMDLLADKKMIRPDTRINLLGNALVLIAPKNSKLNKVEIKQGFDLAKLAGDGRIAIANVRAVPAGLYAKAALRSVGAWEAAEPKLAQAENVRATLAYVARGEAPLGIVYSTDAKIEPDVKIVGVFPTDSHPPITYPIAATAEGKNAAAARYIAFLKTSQSKAIFERYGFRFLIKPVS
jgi:molybdate transport system substrate-binding protein